MPATYEPLVTSTLASAATSITVTGIPTSGYTDIVAVVSSLAFFASGTYMTGGIRVGNGSIDTATNYSNTYLYGDLTTAGSGRTTSDSYIRYVDIPASPTDNGSRGLLIINFMNYSNTNTFKSILIRNNSVQSASGTNITRNHSATWRSTSAIDRFQFTNIDATNFYAGTTITVYGIKAA